jgi:transcription elongation factor Elf1
MNCWHCKTELIWECDHDISEESQRLMMVTDLHCPNCGSEVSVYLPKQYEKTDTTHLQAL